MLKHHAKHRAHGHWTGGHDHAAQSSLWHSGPQSSPHGGAGLLTITQLTQFLGGLGMAAYEAHDALETIRLELMPGDELYACGTVARYAYIVESGLVQCVGPRYGDGHDLPGSVGFASAGELVGLYDQQERRSESVSMVTRGTLLALPLDELKHTQASSPQLDELIARRMCLAMKRDWRIVYRLRDLPPDKRTAAGLAHLVYLAAPEGLKGADEQTLPTDLSMAVLRRWLGLSENELVACLDQLQHDAAISLKGDRIVAVKPQGILNVLNVLGLSRTQAPLNGSDFSESKPSVSD
ncbi:MAG: hypothetical protein V4532_01390 [Pseudomonadota bacterium]